MTNTNDKTYSINFLSERQEDYLLFIGEPTDNREIIEI